MRGIEQHCICNLISVSCAGLARHCLDTFRHDVHQTCDMSDIMILSMCAASYATKADRREALISCAPLQIGSLLKASSKVRI